MSNTEKVALELSRLQNEMRELERVTNARLKRMRNRMARLQEMVKELK